MKPPIPSPDGKIIQTKEPEFDGKERSLSYQAKVLPFTRLQLKSGLFSPASFIALIIVIPVVVIMILPVNIRPLRAFSVWQASLIIAVSIILLAAFILPIILPPIFFVQLAIRGRDETVVINKEGVYNTARSFPISIVWKRVKWIISWSGDVFILTFGGGVFIPRHAFHTFQEAEDFVYAARHFPHKSRQNTGIPV